jgi:hypothetical protein
MTPINRRHTIVRALVGLYPAAWRKEYGAELTDILMARPLSPRVVGDVSWNGLWQRARTTAPSTMLGLASMLFVLAGFVVTPTSYFHEWLAVVRPTSKTLPTIEVTFLASEVYVLMLLGCGCWTHLRCGGTVRLAGVAGMKMSLIAGLPVMLGGVLIALGLLDMVFLAPGATAATLSAHGAPSAAVMIAAPLFRLPESWLWAAIGAQIGRCISRARRKTAAASI